MSGLSRGLHPRFKLWISSEDAQGVFGDGKWRLLAAIERAGSLRAAAQELGISYRKAWGDLKKAEECLGITFIHKHRGGSKGGDTVLTDEGRKWVAAYSRFREDLEQAAEVSFGENISELLDREGKAR
ncbi:MAG: winged helix-turn-helix domain-containing protein [Planctomycetota bacterium]